MFGVLRRKNFQDSKAVAIGGEGACEIALRLEDDADPLVDGCKIALPPGIAGVLEGQRLRDRKGIAIGGEGAWQIVLRLECVAEVGAAAGEIPLQYSIAGVFRC